MAIWQFQIVLIPQQTSEIDFQSIYSDGGYDVSHFWYFFDQKITLIKDLEELLDLTQHLKDSLFFQWGNAKKIDISLMINPQHDYIENLSIRIDVREQFDLVLIEKLINLAKKYRLLLINIGEKRMIGSNVEDIHHAIMHSRAYQFKSL